MTSDAAEQGDRCTLLDMYIGAPSRSSLLLFLALSADLFKEGREGKKVRSRDCFLSPSEGALRTSSSYIDPSEELAIKAASSQL